MRGVRIPYREDLPGEVWKDVPGYDGEYQVSNFGRVRSYKTVGVSKKKFCWLRTPQISDDGYFMVMLTMKGRKSKLVRVHQLVASAFLGPCPAGMIVSHIDESRTNNVVWNLKYATQKENMNMPLARERKSVALRVRRSRNGISHEKFDLKRFRFEQRIRQREIMDVLGCVQSFVSQIEHGDRPMPNGTIAKLRERYGDVIDRYLY